MIRFHIKRQYICYQHTVHIIDLCTGKKTWYFLIDNCLTWAIWQMK